MQLSRILSARRRNKARNGRVRYDTRACTIQECLVGTHIADKGGGMLRHSTGAAWLNQSVVLAGVLVNPCDTHP